MGRTLRLAMPLVLAALSACADNVPGGVEPPLAPSPESPLAVLECTVRVAERGVSCASAAPNGGGARGSLIVGGQGTYVQLRSGNVAYDTINGVFSADFTLQNLLGQPVGTEDGTTASGVRIFFHLQPVATAGAGVVEVSNPDGVGTFTGAGQPYFFYPEILAPYERSAPRRWEWLLPRTVEAFSFQVYVAARVPNEAGVLRWTRERGDVVTRNLWSIWGTGPNDIWVGGNRTLMYSNGTRWVVMPGDWDGGVGSIWGSATDDVWAAGEVIRRYDGRRWRTVAPPVKASGYGNLWGSSADNVYLTASGGWLLRWDGAAWDTVLTPKPGRLLSGVWGSGPDDVFVAGYRDNFYTGLDAFVLHWNGTAWDSTAFPGTYLNSVWGSSGSDVYAVGGEGGVYHYDGGAWSRVAAGLTPMPLYRVWGSGPDDVWAVGGGQPMAGPEEATVLHYDGAQWRKVDTGGGAAAWAVYAPNPDRVYVVGERGMIRRRTGGAWQAESSGSAEVVNGVWPVGDDDAYAATCGGVLRNDGAGWKTEYATPDCLSGIWATPGGTRVFAVGETEVGDDAVIVRWDGERWSRTVVADVRSLVGVWGSGPDDVWAVGYTRATDPGGQKPVIRHWGGARWTGVPTGVTGWGMLHAVGGSSAGDVYAVGTQVLRWDGAAWRPVAGMSEAETGDIYNAVWASGPDDVYVAGSLVHHWNGAAWSRFTPRTLFTGRGVWGSGPGDVYVVGTHTLHFNGTAWTEVNLEASATLYGIGGVSERRVWAVGEGGVVMRGRR